LTIVAELASYGNEDEFVHRFLVPLFGRLGFSIVVDYHGMQEFGKDLVLGEIDNFGHVCYYGVQAKYEPSLGKSEAHGLIQDCDEAFAKEFDHPQTGARHRISKFYAVNGGSISAEARALVFATLQPRHADNIRLLDGKELLDLDRSAAIRSENARDLLVALLLEARFNAGTVAILAPDLQAIVVGTGHGVVYPTARLRVVATAAWLARPIMLSALPADSIEELYSRATAFNRHLDDAGTSPLHTVDSIRVPAAKALGEVSSLAKILATVQKALRDLLSQLGPVAPI
jgi:hypothetical protein